ncbi:MAG: hemolysin III family protein [Oscillospiraceae bacterium]
MDHVQHATPPEDRLSPDAGQTRKHPPQEKGRDPYDGLRPWSAITHGAGIALGLVGTILLLFRAFSLGCSLWHLVSFAIYGASMIGLYTASTLYHCLRTTVPLRVALRKYDHASIYLLIAGSYTPICLTVLRGPWGWALFFVIWGFAVAGVVMTLFWVNAPRWVTSSIYIFMGWLAVFAIVPLVKVMPAGGLFWLFFGGVLYTLGGVLYAVKWPGRNNPRFGCHEIFHVFILLGSIAHFMMMYRVLCFA